MKKEIYISLVAVQYEIIVAARLAIWALEKECALSFLGFMPSRHMSVKVMYKDGTEGQAKIKHWGFKSDGEFFIGLYIGEVANEVEVPYDKKVKKL